MKKTVIFIFYLLVTGNILFAQSNFTLLGEGNGENISLIWSVDHWDANLDGVFIKKRSIRKDGSSTPWENLTKEILKPYNKQDKSLNNISNSKSIIRALEKKRIALLQNTANGSTKITEINAESFKQEIQADTAVYKMLCLMFLFDYDVALMYGFGFVDTDYPNRGSVEYGLFPMISGIESSAPVATFKWAANDVPDLDVNVIKEKIKKKGSRIQLRIEYDGKQLDSKETLAGFNIYRKIANESFNRINNKVVWLSKASNKRVLHYSDILNDEDQEYTYSIKPVSIFSNEGNGFELTWSMANEVTLQAPELYTEQHPNYDFIQGGVSLQWNFNEHHESEITGFVIQRRIGSESDFITVSDTLSAKTRVYKDHSLNPSDTKNYHYRIIVQPKESFAIWSNVLRLFYNPKPIVEDVKSLTASSRIENNQVHVQLNWTADEDFINQINGFLVYCDRSGGVLAKEANIAPLKATSYNYLVEGGTGRKYKFNVKYQDTDNSPSDYTDTITVVIPSKKLPFVTIWPFSVEENDLSFEWRFPNDIADLKGFRVFLNNELVRNENDIDAAQRSWLIEDLEAGDYELEIQAVSESGVTSKRSQKRIIAIE
ncbi:fibronectin type III domain-containing protein [Carboxylicivirga mesophila]|uniref:Fibronectin type III domain-containing protein n=1 Tax=Carboxylicivirga mesophila TaxID=1166478 RepID=A0ABS5KH39_9BACT|nr:fibronectin type III domain-containing protein [Carboxylicivirga mesophila]MBS2213781.1 fibronectin type III domain-containing protein [Carboxylicivirga mesophila]